MRRLALIATILLACCVRVAAAASPAATLKLATWNLEWLMTPATFNALKGSCTRAAPASESAPHAARPLRSIPCDVVATLERGRADLAGLARYARALDADVIALQEVDGEAAAALVFPPSGYRFCFSGAQALQNTGFAIRRGIPHRCGPDVMGLALGNRVRRGATLVLYPGTPGELHLLDVHLKSGCARGPMSGGAPAEACALLARQVPALETGLITKRAAAPATPCWATSTASCCPNAARRARRTAATEPLAGDRRRRAGRRATDKFRGGRTV